jgi:hypothetical protein
LNGFSINSGMITGCMLSALSNMSFQLSASCFPSNVPALSNFSIVFGNVINPYSTKPSDSWTVQILSNNYVIQLLTTGISVTMVTPAKISNFIITPSILTVNAITTYLFALTFAYPHYSGDSIILTLPTSITLNNGFQCDSQSATISCITKSQYTLQIIFTFTNSTTINNLSFTISNITNNWFVNPISFNIQTATN